MNWLAAFSRLFLILDKQKTPAYHSGSDFIKVIQQYDPGQAGYTLFLKERNRRGLSSSRKDFYWDKLQGVDESLRYDIEQQLAQAAYPKIMVTSISTLTNAIANSRNGFSDSHFDQDSYKWLASYTRDLVNSIGRLILHFV